MEGEIVESPSGMFRITLDNGHQMIGYTAGKMKRYRIRMAPGDRVKVEVSLYDLDRDASSTECGSGWPVEPMSCRSSSQGCSHSTSRL